MSIFGLAVQSVQRRGFWDPDALLPVSANRRMTEQYGRLVEEVGELWRALRKGDRDGARREWADVIIVAAQIGELLGIEDPERVIAEKLLADEARGRLHQG